MGGTGAGRPGARASKRDVVVGEVLDRRRLAAGRGLLARLLALRARAFVAAATVATAAEHLHLVGDDVGVVALLAVVADVLAVADPALDVDLRAFAQVFGRDLGELAEEGHAVPLGLFLGVAVPVLAHRGGGQADLGDGHAALGVAGFGIVAEIADKDRLVDATGHWESSDVAGAPGERHWIIARGPKASNHDARPRRTAPRRATGGIL